jgi:hypothetical protein
MEEDSLLEDIKEYSSKDLRDLERMTEEVLQHWKTMLSHPNITESTKKAVEMSIQTSENDLKIVREQLKKIDNSAS